MSNSRCASITSSPLFTRVAELMVITGPMSQVGWAIACSTVTSRQLGAGRPPERPAAGGDQQPAHVGRVLAAQRLRQGRVLRVDRHDLAGPGRVP